MRDFTDDLRDTRKRLEEAATYLRVDSARARLAELTDIAGDPALWEDQDRARAVTTELARVRDDVELYDRLAGELSDAEVLAEMAREESDESQEPEIEAVLGSIASELDALELRSLFTGEHDDADAIVRINAKDGGTDAQDFAEMLLRMYLRWAERRGFSAVVEETTEGTEAGLLNAGFRVQGRYAYGLLAGERGVHRLVRISPFDGNARRQTSFVAVDVIPVLSDVGAVVIEDKDLRVDTYRSSGAGGQHVNKTDSAVRITHLPTGVVVSCQNERSQLQNREQAMATLRAILAARAEEERRAQLDALSGPKAQVGWGSQMRSYVLHPYQMVKDLRTEHESSDPQSVLDGDLDEFLEAFLRWQRAEATVTA